MGNSRVPQVQEIRPYIGTRFLGSLGWSPQLGILCLLQWWNQTWWTLGPAVLPLLVGRYTHGALAPNSSSRWAMNLARVSACCPEMRGRPQHSSRVWQVVQPLSFSGLGRHAEGRVEPIHAVVLPRGKSLDQCAEILQKKTKRGQAGASRPPKCQRSGNRSEGRPPSRNVFDFLNEKLQSQVPGTPDAGVDTPERKNKDMYHASKSAKQALSLQLFQTEEKIERTQRDIRGIQEALTRNTGRYVWDPAEAVWAPVAMPRGYLLKVT